MSEFDQFRRQLAELGSSLNDLEYSDAREKFDNLQKIFEVNLSTIPDHEQKLANREIHDLHKKIEKVSYEYFGPTIFIFENGNFESKLWIITYNWRLPKLPFSKTKMVGSKNDHQVDAEITRHHSGQFCDLAR